MIAKLFKKLKNKLRPKKKAAVKKNKKAASKKKTIKRKPKLSKRPLKRRASSKLKRPKAKARRIKKAKKQIVKTAYVPSASEVLMGEITHFFPKVSAAVFVVANSGLKVGDTIKIVGHTTDFTQQVGSMQIDRKPIELAEKGDEIGLAVKMRVRRKDKVYKQK